MQNILSLLQCIPIILVLSLHIKLQRTNFSITFSNDIIKVFCKNLKQGSVLGEASDERISMAQNKYR